MVKRFLITPGPTPVPPEVLLAAAEPVIHHRAPRFGEVLNEVIDGLRYVYQTANDVIVFSASGTGGMESAVVNLVQPGDHVLVGSCGNFGERWIKLNRTWGAEVTAIEAEWGTRVDPAAIEQALAADPAIKAVFVQQSETSTGVVNDVRAIGAIVARTPAVLVVDAISGLGATDLPTDEWQVEPFDDPCWRAMRGIAEAGSRGQARRRSRYLPPADRCRSPSARDLRTSRRSSATQPADRRRASCVRANRGGPP